MHADLNSKVFGKLTHISEVVLSVHLYTLRATSLVEVVLSVHLCTLRTTSVAHVVAGNLRLAELRIRLKTGS